MCLIVMVSDVYVIFLQMLTAECLHVLYGISCFIVMSSFLCVGIFCLCVLCLFKGYMY